MISLDFETYCDIDIRKVGLDAYTAHPTFEVMMMAYRLDDGPLSHWQAHQGPFPQEVRERLVDPAQEKWAYNSAFERRALLCGLGIETPVEGWRCSMALAYMRGFTGSLGAVGEQMLIPTDQQKQKIGARLIRKFCMPQRITRNQPHRRRDWNTDPDDWELFGEYNRTDVFAEEAIRDRIINYPIPEDEWLLYELDQKVNDRGMPFDRVFATNVARMSEARRDELLDRMRALTGLENPNSQAELLRWLRTQGYPFEDIRENTVKRALALNLPCAEVLRLRQWSGKTATKKAATALLSAGQDDRIRHMYKFVGASRTGRWSGALVQPQNLARTPKFLDPEKSSERLDTVTDLIRQGDYEIFPLLVEEPMAVFGGTMRGMFRASPGHMLHICDYSSIEAVGLAWASRCERMLDVFRSGRDIYRDFGVGLYKKPYETITSAERQICKPVVLGCLGPDTLVLTDVGWKAITDIGLADRVFDGVEFVEHSGMVDQGVKSVIGLNGLQVTPDHLVLCGEEWCAAADVSRNTRLEKQAICLGVGGLSRLYGGRAESCITDVSVPGVEQSRSFIGTILNSVSRKAAFCARMPVFTKSITASISGSMRRARSSTGLPIGIMRSYPVASVAQAFPAPGMPVGGSTVYSLMSTSLSGIASRFPAWVIPIWKSTASTITEITSRGIYGLLHARFSAATRKFFGGLPIAVKRCAQPSSGNGMRRNTEVLERLAGKRQRGCLPSRSSQIKPTVEVRTYDISDCGPRSRFMVWTDAGPMIVHNCGYGLGPGKVLEDGSMTGLLGYAAAMGVELSPEEALTAVRTYRDTYAEVVSFWWACSDAAQAVLEEHRPVTVGAFRFEFRKPFLTIRLPSSRLLYYYKPRMEMREIHTGKQRWDQQQMRMVDEVYVRNVLTFMGRNQRTSQWERIVGRGPHLVENLTQALTRDILKVGLQRLDREGFQIVGHSHDEIIVESREDDTERTWERMRSWMIQPIPWLPGFPIGAAGWSGLYYRK